jgi:hypothetical protein
MATEILSCPYCNASINLPPNRTAGQRITCPRCGDSFPLRSTDTFTNRPPKAGPDKTAVSRSAPSVASPQSRRSHGLVASAVIGVMLLMAGVGLAFMLMTQGERRAHDTSRPPRRPGKQPGVAEAEIASVAAVSPDKLAALSYLPPGVNFLVGVRIAELLAGPVGMQVLRNPIQLGESEYRLENLPAWVGLRLEDIDHFVFAARVEDAVIPPFYLVLRTAKPYVEESMRQRLKVTRLGSAGKKKLYSFRTPRKDIPLNVWFADDKTLVLALFADQLESLPAQPSEDLRQLPDEVRSVLRTRQEPIAPVWIVGHSRNWSKTSAAKFMGRMKKEDLERLTAMRTFGIWFVPEKTLEVKAVFGCKDEASARGLDDYFHALRGPDPTFKTALNGPWLTLQWQTGPDFLSRWMK